MSTQAQYQPDEEPVSGWALGGVAFAACILTLVGFFQIIAGVVAIIDDDFYVVAQNYTFDLDASGWGWIHLLLGILLVITGFGLFNRAAWAGYTALFLAGRGPACTDECAAAQPRPRAWRDPRTPRSRSLGGGFRARSRGPRRDRQDRAAAGGRARGTRARHVRAERARRRARAR